ncbi:MAG: hypothetical protein ACFWT5_13750 [Pseudomonas helleri]
MSEIGSRLRQERERLAFRRKFLARSEALRPMPKVSMNMVIVRQKLIICHV